MAEPPVPPVPVQPVPPVPVQPVLPTVDDLLGVYIVARGPTRAEYLAMNDTLTRLADSIKDLATKDDLKELATKASVEATVKDSVKEAVKDLATKASVKELIKQGVENLATKDGVDDLALNIQDLTEAFDKMAYNVRAKAINKTR